TEEDEAEGVILRRAGGGDVAAVLAVDLAAVEDIRAGAVDEINTALDVTVAEVVPAGVGEERVLPAEQAAVAQDGAVALEAPRRWTDVSRPAPAASAVCNRLATPEAPAPPAAAHRP